MCAFWLLGLPFLSFTALNKIIETVKCIFFDFTTHCGSLTGSSVLYQFIFHVINSGFHYTCFRNVAIRRGVVPRHPDILQLNCLTKSHLSAFLRMETLAMCPADLL